MFKHSYFLLVLAILMTIALAVACGSQSSDDDDDDDNDDDNDTGDDDDDNDTGDDDDDDDDTGDDDDDDDTTCQDFCDQIIACEAGARLEIETMDDCLAYCSGGDATIMSCVINHAGDCPAVVECAEPKIGTDMGDIVADFTLKDSQGNDVSLYDYYGQVILVDFSTGWCPPCNEEAALLEDNLYQPYKDQGDGFVILSLMSEGWSQGSLPTEAFLQAWVSQYGLTFPVLADKNGSIYFRYGDGYIPYNMILDQEAIIRYSDSNFNLNYFKTVIEGLLGID